MFESLREYVSTLPEVLQWLGVMLAGMIPFIESYLGSVLGIIVGVPLPIAIVAAIIGNVISMLAFVLPAGAIRERLASSEPKPETPRRARLRRVFNRYGVPGVSLLGQLILPSQFTSAAMVSFGAPKRLVIFWQVISITLWGVGMALIVYYGIDLFSSAEPAVEAVTPPPA